MAGFGAKYPCFAPMTAETESSITYGTGVVLGKLVKADLAVSNATGELWADDIKCESVKEFGSGTLTMETDSMSDSVAETVYGCTATGGVVTYNKNDTIPYGCVGYYKILRRSNVNVYKGYFYPKCQAEIGSDSAETRGASINFTTEQTIFTVDASLSGKWKEVEEFSTESACKAWIQTKCSISTT